MIDVNLFMGNDIWWWELITIKDERIKHDGVDLEGFKNFTVGYIHKKKGTPADPFPDLAVYSSSMMKITTDLDAFPGTLTVVSVFGIPAVSRDFLI